MSELLITGPISQLALFIRPYTQVPPRRKLDLEEIRAALNITYPLCNASVPPDKQVRLDFEHMQCPCCGQVFTPEKK